jgi:beta-lactamase class A
MPSRRRFVALTAAALPGLLLAARRRLTALPAALACLEQVNGGRLGVAVIDTATGEHAGYRGRERFPMCSTFKFLLTSAVLQKVDHGQERLDRSIAIPPEPLLAHSPLTQPHAGGTMTIDALCHAALNQSDNTGANLLLGTIGGPAAITQFARSIGDTVTRLDRNEPTLNESRDHDPRDTTSPEAMAGNLRKILLGNVLTADSRNQMLQWMQGSLTGLDRLRARIGELVTESLV